MARLSESPASLQQLAEHLQPAGISAAEVNSAVMGMLGRRELRCNFEVRLSVQTIVWI